MKRYEQLNEIISQLHPETIVEVGTWDGTRAVQMATEALKHKEKVHYTGFDLFEDATAETDEQELNVKYHCSEGDVREKLLLFSKDNPGFEFRLIKGNTRDTLRQGVVENIDLAFVDGGHSVGSIANDYEALVGRCKCIVFDDLYGEDDDGNIPDIEKFGCNKLLKEIEVTAAPMPQADPVKGGGLVGMACVGWQPKMGGSRPLKIKTKNSVPDEQIQNQCKYSISHGLPEVGLCRIHKNTALIISAGITFKDKLNKIRILAKKRDHFLFCVKHSHDYLIERKIIPDACILLDPRDHVQDFIENPHPDVVYMVASQVHPSTLDGLIEKRAKIILYHAKVGAGEDKILGENRMQILGGSTSATRGISVLHALGFRHFVMYGYDSCYFGDVDWTKKNKMGGKKYISVNVLGKDFTSDPELVAQAQDAEQLIQTDLDFDAVGEGMIPHIFNHAKYSGNYANFLDFWETNGVQNKNK